MYPTFVFGHFYAILTGKKKKRMTNIALFQYFRNNMTKSFDLMQHVQVANGIDI